MNRPLISIITINYNNLEGLKKTMASVIEQTWQEFEYIVIDGGSTDGSAEYIKSKDSNVDYWISESDSGIYNAMNKGIAKASGKYVVFMNSGDYYLSSNTLQLCKNIICNQDADIFYGQIKIDENGVEKAIVYPNKLNLSYLKKMVLNHQACFFKLDLLLSLQGYNEEYILAADYHYYLKAYLAGKKFHPILFPIVKYDVAGISSLSMEDYQLEMKRVWADTVPLILLELELNHFNLLAKIKSSLILRFAFKIREYKIKIFNGK